MSLRLFNTETRMIEEVIPQNGTLLLYACGPTVYDFAHIGNFRTFVIEDLLVKLIRSQNMALKHVMNITDVDDKTIFRSKEASQTLQEYTDFYTKAFLEDSKILCIDRPDEMPRATAFIPQMIEMIQMLLESNRAYRGEDGSIYYAVAKCPGYGKLSKMPQESLHSHILNDEYAKDHVCDFALWKAYDPERDGKVFWESSFGKGRPGWHIECSSMAKSLLGETIDIHAGGVDLIFPHHENEIAQSEACTGKQFCRHWFHIEHLLVDRKKMSKSLGNFYTLRDLLNMGYSGPIIRYMLLSTHYRMQLNFTMEGLGAAKAAVERINDFAKRVQENSHDDGLLTASFDAYIQKQEKMFFEYLLDDLHIAEALSTVFQVIKYTNTLLDSGTLTSKDKKRAVHFIETVDQILCVVEKETEVLPLIEELLKKREDARKNKDFAASDRFRKEIEEHGYLVEDTPNGQRLKAR